MRMVWHLIEKNGEREWVEAPARRSRGKAQAPEGYDDAELIEVRDAPPDPIAGEAALLERDAEQWIERLPPLVLDLLADLLAEKVAARLTVGPGSGQAAVTDDQEKRQG